MTTYYVGKGGSDVADGLSWANRRLTIDACESVSGGLDPGDLVIVGPGTYRDSLNPSISNEGTAGNLIWYEGDPTGKRTDGVGGAVIITGSDDDLVGNRAQCIDNSQCDYRGYKNFTLTGTDFGDEMILIIESNGVVVEDCVFDFLERLSYGVHVENPNMDNVLFEVRRCYFVARGSPCYGVRCYDSATERPVHANSIVENCFFFNTGLDMNRMYNLTVKNNTFIGENITYVNVSVGNKSYLYNNLFVDSRISGSGTHSDYMEEDYGVYSGPFADDGPSPTASGVNTDIQPINLIPPLLLNEFVLPFNIPVLAPWNTVAYLGCGQSPPSEDMYGVNRPTADSKKTRGAIQYSAPERETTTVYTGSEASIKFADAMYHQIFIPITGSNMRVRARVYREANYTGTNPSIAIKQYGKGDIILVDTGSASTWNLLEIKFKPDDLPPFVMLELRSDNTATSGSYAVYFDALEAK